MAGEVKRTQPQLDFFQNNLPHSCFASRRGLCFDLPIASHFFSGAYAESFYHLEKPMMPTRIYQECWSSSDCYLNAFYFITCIFTQNFSAWSYTNNLALVYCCGKLFRFSCLYILVRYRNNLNNHLGIKLLPFYFNAKSLVSPNIYKKGKGHLFHTCYTYFDMQALTHGIDSSSESTKE